MQLNHYFFDYLSETAKCKYKINIYTNFLFIFYDNHVYRLQFTHKCYSLIDKYIHYIGHIDDYFIF